MNQSLTAEPTVQQLFDLSGRTVLITGGTGYLGSAMSRALAESGANVVVASRSEQRASEFAATLPCNHGSRHFGIALDHLDPADVERGFHLAVRLSGKIDSLINNANEPVPFDWSTVTAEHFARQLQNSVGYFLLARLLRDHAVSRQAPGNVVMLGSMYGQVASYPDAYEGIMHASPVAYHAMKGGVIHMTRHLAVYWAKDQIRVNCLSPGPFPAENVHPAMIDRLCTKSPMRRMGKPSELKAAIVFLTSEASSYMTGQNLTIDGGWTAW